MITIKLFGLVKSLADNKAELVWPKDGTRTVKDLIARLDATYPKIGELLHKKRVLISVNQDIAHEDLEIKDGDEVALLPPFAGGV
ncbi:MAG: MoaD/ThiS family protein, partial [Nitrospirales bacterium]